VEGTIGHLYEASGTRRSHRIFGASRHACPDHGYKDPRAPRFLEYSVWRYVDLQDPDGVRGRNSSATPRKPHVPVQAINGSYDGFFTEAFAERIGVRDPNTAHAVPNALSDCRADA